MGKDVPSRCVFVHEFLLLASLGVSPEEGPSDWVLPIVAGRECGFEFSDSVGDNEREAPGAAPQQHQRDHPHSGTGPHAAPLTLCNRRQGLSWNYAEAPAANSDGTHHHFTQINT